MTKAQLKMVNNMRNKLLFIFLGIIIFAANYMIIHKEKVLSSGELVLLRVGPVDPRSLVAGDYMTLDFALTRNVERAIEKPTADGYLVITRDKDNVAQYVRIHDSKQALVEGESLLRFRVRNNVAKITTNAFHFQEGHGKYYNGALYGEVMVDDSGDAVLVGMRTRDFKQIKPKEIIAAKAEKMINRNN